jgi:dienelactone hydrolase
MTVRTVLLAGCALALAGCGGGSPRRAVALTTPSTTVTTSSTTATATTTSRRPRPAPGPPFRIAERVLTLVDRSRTLPGTSEPRQLVTIVRYPTGAAGQRPLVVFGHGFAVTPAPYSRLLDAWARAGYVVAAPIFPLGNANAPGGPNEADLVHQPRDVSFVITRLLRLLARRIDPRRIAVAGQSDGGETALAVAYDVHFVDRRVRAAIILSGAKIPGVGGFDFPAPSPPLLATQGTADTINPPSFTHAFYDTAPRPKYLLSMFGAPHLGPYTDEQPQLGVVERVTIAFLRRYLNGDAGALRQMARSGDVPGVAALASEP